MNKIFNSLFMTMTIAQSILYTQVFWFFDSTSNFNIIQISAIAIIVANIIFCCIIVSVPNETSLKVLFNITSFGLLALSSYYIYTLLFVSVIKFIFLIMASIISVALIFIVWLHGILKNDKKIDNNEIKKIVENILENQNIVAPQVGVTNVNNLTADNIPDPSQIQSKIKDIQDELTISVHSLVENVDKTGEFNGINKDKVLQEIELERTTNMDEEIQRTINLEKSRADYIRQKERLEKYHRDNNK